MNRQTCDDRFVSEDLYLCAFLLTKEHNILGFQQNGHKVSLHFSRSPAIEKDVMAYYNQGKATASRLFDAYRRLKDMVFQTLKEKK